MKCDMSRFAWSASELADLEEAFGHHDADDDGRIGKAELEAHFLRKEATAWGRVKEFWYVSQLTRQVLFSFSC